MPAKKNGTEVLNCNGKNVAWINVHGGGAIGGSPELETGICSYTAINNCCIVFNPEYRLAGTGGTTAD